MGDKMYIRVTEGLADKGTMIPTNKNILTEMNIDPNKDYYYSIYKYSEENKKQFDETGTVSGMNDLTTDMLVFDFDSTDLEKARFDCVELVTRLKKYSIPEESIILYFSGGKGFHVLVKTDTQFDSSTLKKLCKVIGKDLKTMDSVIYNDNRILRMPQTKHPKTGLFKTRIALDELRELTIEEIKDLCKEQYDDDMDYPMVKLPKSVLSLIEQKEEKVEESTLLNDLDLSKKPKDISAWKYALTQGFFPPGQRSNALMILASTYKAKGFPAEVTYRMLKGVIELQSRRHKEEPFDKSEIWNNVIGQVYSDRWLGKTYSEDNFPQQIQDYLIKMGVPRSNTENEPVFAETKQVFSAFKKFAENIDKNTVKTGIPELDQRLQMTTSMLCGLLGSPSSGKTSFALEVLKNTSLMGEKTAFFSMDMGSSLVFQRLAQKVTGYESKKLFDIFKSSNDKEINKIYYKIDQAYKNTKFCFKTALTTQAIKDALILEEQTTGVKTRLAVVDYLECISSEISDPTARVSDVAQKLKDIAIELDICILLLLQPPKRVGDPSKEILSYSDIKGAATIAQACSVVLSLWRDGFNPRDVENDRFISFAVLKNRMGQLSQVDCSFDGLTGEVGELDDTDKEELKQLRALKKKYEGDL